MRTLSAVFAALAVASAGVSHAQEKPVSVVLVHGAFVDGSGWRPVFDRLSTKGYEVLVVQNGTVTLEEDVAATEAAIALARHPVVLVGHSYGGAVITQAGGSDKVRSLIYIAAFAPDAGESVHDLIATPVPGAPEVPIVPSREGFVVIDRARFAAQFAGDAEPGVGEFMAASQVPWGLAAMGGEITSPAWKTKTTYYIVTTNDHIVPPVAQRQMAARAGATVTDVPSHHAVMVSHPDAIVSVIETAAAAID